MKPTFLALATVVLLAATLVINAAHMNDLDFEVENKTGRTIFVTCFAYVHKGDFRHWRWDKSPVVEIPDGKTDFIDVDTIDDAQDRENTYGYLSVFNDKKNADEAVIELVDERNLLDLDRLINLKNKKVIVEIEKYGLKEFYEYDFTAQNAEIKKSPELDFVVENRTGKTIIVCCFVYQKRGKGRWIPELGEKDDASVWRFDKTPLVTIKPGQQQKIDADTIIAVRDRTYVRGYLAVFDGNERNKAEQSTYEHLESNRKLNLGLLSTIKNKKIIVEVEKYGIMPNFIDYTIKPLSKIDFKTVNR
jgi:hypothetical protein